MEIDPAEIEKVSKIIMEEALITPAMAKRAEELSLEFAKSPRDIYVAVIALTVASKIRDLPFTNTFAQIGAFLLKALEEMKAEEGKSHGTDPSTN